MSDVDASVTVPATYCGYVVLIGRPNVGKSTLLNQLLAQKISITAPKPQTTRHAILGIKTLPERQIVYLDTPGLHSDGKRAINRYMNRAASSTLGYADVVVFVIEALRWTDEDQAVLQRLETFSKPVIVALNKDDKVADKRSLLPYLAALNQRREWAATVPLSALKNANVSGLEQVIAKHLPPALFMFDQDQVTTASLRFLAAEIIREKLVRLLHAELPYALTVMIEQFSEEDQLTRIAAVIWVERAGQKTIVIGSKGATLKTVGQQARHDLEILLQTKVFLQTWVKVRAGWSDDERALAGLGYQ